MRRRGSVPAPTEVEEGEEGDGDSYLWGHGLPPLNTSLYGGSFKDISRIISYVFSRLVTQGKRERIEERSFPQE